MIPSTVKMLTSQLPIALRMSKKRSKTLALTKEGIFIYQLFWTQACPEGMCTNGIQALCEVPSLPTPTTRKGWPHHRGGSTTPTLFE